jgi:hypothetical protein
LYCAVKTYWLPLPSTMVNVYYQIPECNNQQETTLMMLLYENMKLRIELAIQPVRKVVDKEDGIILIERQEHSAEIVYKGFSPEVELILKFCIAQIKEKQKLRF